MKKEKIEEVNVEKQTEEDKKKKKLITNIIFWLVMLVLFITWITDFVKTQNYDTPVFTFKKNELVYKDGTITEYIGLGYKVVYYDRDSMSLQTQFSPIFIETKGLNEVK